MLPLFKSKSLSNTPSQAINPVGQPFVRDVELIGPLGNVKCYAVIRQEPSLSCITGLHELISPSAVGFAVPKFVVDSIKGRSFRAVPHISVEVLKRVNPLRAYRYSSPSVIRKSLMVYVETSTEHGAPGFVLSGFAHSVGYAKGRALSGKSVPKTAARPRNAASETPCRNNCGLPAVTQTNPLRRLRLAGRIKLSNNKHTKPFPREIVPMFYATTRCTFFLQASARPRSAISKTMCWNDQFVSALTSADVSTNNFGNCRES